MEDFRTQLARNLYEMFEMRTGRPWDAVGVEGDYEDMHREWLEAADELIERMTEDGDGHG
jgi:hypothetical protein